MSDVVLRSGVEVWSDTEAAGGTRQSVFTEPLRVTDFEEIPDNGHVSPRDQLTAEASAEAAAMDDVTQGKVLRVELSDGEAREWRVWKVTTDRSGGELRATIECRHIAWDLFTRTPLLEITEAGMKDTDFAFKGLTPAEWIDDLILVTTDWPSWIVKGTIEATTRHSLNVDWTHAGPLLDKLAELSGHEWTLRRNGSTDYQIEVLAERGASSARPIIAAELNLLSAARETTAENQVTRVYPQGGGAAGFKANMGEARWTVGSTSTPNSITQTEDFSHADWNNDVGTGTVTVDDAVAPDGQTTADKLEDTDGTAITRWQQTLTVADDSLDRTISVFLRKASGRPSARLRLTYFGGTTASYEFIVKPETGAASAATDLSGGTEGVDFDVEDWDDNWWRVWIVGANNGTGNTSTQLVVEPAYGPNDTFGGDASVTGFNHFWGSQYEGLSGGASSVGPYVPHPNGELLTLSDPAGGDGPVGFDDQFGVTSGSISAYVEDSTGSTTAIMGSDASADTVSVRDGTNISATDLVPIRLNAAGDELIYLQHPSNFDTYGLYSRPLERADVPDVQNLLSDVADAYLDTDTDADGLADGWNKVGTPTTTMDTDAANHKHGTGSQKVVASVDEGIESDPITVDPTTTRPYFAAEGRVKAESGTVQIHIVDATNNDRLHPKSEVNSGRTPNLNTIEAITSAPGVNFDDLSTTQIKVRFVARGGSSTFYVDGASLVQQQTPVGRVVEGRGANVLWQAANDHLANKSSPEDRWDIDPIDLYRADASRWPDQQIDVGQTVIVKDTGLNTDAELRVVARERDLLVPGRVQVTVDHRPKTLAERINQRQIDQLFDDQPASSGANRTEGTNPDRLNSGAGTVAGSAAPGRYVVASVSDASFVSGSFSPNAGDMRVSAFQASTTMEIQSLEIKDNGGGAGIVRTVIYSDDGFYPDTLLHESGDLTLDGTPNQITVAGPIIEVEKGQTYWVGVQCTANSSGTASVAGIGGDIFPSLGFSSNFGDQGFASLESTGNGSVVPDVFPASATAIQAIVWVAMEVPS